MRRGRSISLSIAVLLLLSAAPADAAPRWKKKLRKLTASKTTSVLVSAAGETIYQRRARWRRIPASNEKLLLSMALLDTLGPGARFRTRALVEPKPPPYLDAGEPNVHNGVLRSNLWILGGGDPTLASSSSGYGWNLGVEATWIGDLARAIKRSGVRRVKGRVIGVREDPFAHDWDAPGWRPHFNERYIALPSALSLNGNVHEGGFIRDPELRAARALTRALEKRGVAVRGGARARTRPSGVVKLATVRSRPLRKLLTHMNRRSSNFFAEVLGKALAVAAGRRTGTIAAGAAALRRWIRDRGARARVYDGSGLSYRNRVSARGLSSCCAERSDPSGVTRCSARCRRPAGGRSRAGSAACA